MHIRLLTSTWLRRRFPINASDFADITKSFRGGTLRMRDWEQEARTSEDNGYDLFLRNWLGDNSFYVNFGSSISWSWSKSPCGHRPENGLSASVRYRNQRRDSQDACVAKAIAQRILLGRIREYFG